MIKRGQFRLAKSAGLADIFEAMIRLDDALKHSEVNISHARMNAAIAPQDPLARLKLGILLVRFGNYEEAIQQFRAAFPLIETLEPCCRAECLEQTGRYHYHRGEYREAFEWFIRAANVEPGDNPFVPRLVQAAIERQILTCCKLGLEDEARTLAQDFIANYGRLSRPVRKELGALKIDSDAMYVMEINTVV